MQGTCSANRLLLPVVLLAALVAVGCNLFDNDDVRGVDIDPGAATSITMTPEPDQPAPGEVFDVIFRIFFARDVVSMPFKLRFDPAVIAFDRTGSLLGPFLQSSGANVVFLTEHAAGGEVWVALSILGAASGQGVSGTGELCRLRFRVLPGTTAASFSIIPFEAHLFGPGLAEHPVVFPSLTRPLP